MSLSAIGIFFHYAVWYLRFNVKNKCIQQGQISFTVCFFKSHHKTHDLYKTCVSIAKLTAGQFGYAHVHLKP